MTIINILLVLSRFCMCSSFLCMTVWTNYLECDSDSAHTSSDSAHTNCDSAHPICDSAHSTKSGPSDKSSWESFSLSLSSSCFVQRVNQWRVPAGLLKDSSPLLRVSSKHRLSIRMKRSGDYHPHVPSSLAL